MTKAIDPTDKTRLFTFDHSIDTMTFECANFRFAFDIQPKSERIYLLEYSHPDKKWHSVSLTKDKIAVSYFIPHMSYFRDAAHGFTSMVERLGEIRCAGVILARISPWMFMCIG